MSIKKQASQEEALREIELGIGKIAAEMVATLKEVQRVISEDIQKQIIKNRSLQKSGQEVTHEITSPGLRGRNQ